MENDIVPKYNIPFKTIEIYGLSKNPIKGIKALTCFVKSYNKCKKIIKEFNPDVVVGVGGYVTGPVIFGEPGTNGQHSFYQLLHQGTNIIPLQFIAFQENQTGKDVVIEGSTSQKKLCANVAAQIVAFACGKDDSDPNKNFAGERPSSIIYGKQLTPETLGALLSHFENKVMFQGFLWNVNSFDQEGVQLGKKLAKKVLAHDTDGALKVYSDLLKI